MYIQRYIHKNRSKVDPFGNHSLKYRWDFDWYIGDNKIGVKGNPSIEAEFFIEGILISDDELIITPSQKRPRIQRANFCWGVMEGDEGGLEEIGKLIKLIKSRDVTNMHMSSAKPNSYANILTFSQITPSKEFYEKGKILPIKIDEDAVRQEIEWESLLKTIKS